MLRFVVQMLAICLLISVATIGTTLSSEVKNSTTGKICTSRYIRKPIDLQSLNDCRVIEGNLQIGLMGNTAPHDFQNFAFPFLREISGYFLLYSVHGLLTLRHLFPNLAVIRGQDFIYDYAFLIDTLPDLEEVGLPSLTNVMGRGVFLNNNPHLCYVDTIDWGLIANDSSRISIQKNRRRDYCSNICLPTCPKSDADARFLCWNKDQCQTVHRKSSNECESGLTFGMNNECCSSQCLGGCTGPSPSDCFVCKHFENKLSDDSEKGILCSPRCENGKYEFSDRRCVTKIECSEITRYNPQKIKSYRGMILNDDNKCVLECPKYYAKKTVGSFTFCERCKEECKKYCKSTRIDSIESSQDLEGCTHIVGSLTLQIRGYSPNIMTDLKHNLDTIEEINGSLIIINSPFITSLEFLSSLKVIHGPKQDNVKNHIKFAVEVRSNDNIQALFGINQTVLIPNPKSRVLFHYNPKLCPQIIWRFVNLSKIEKPPDNKIDVGITNGDKVTCNEKAMSLYEVEKSHNSVMIKWQNFQKYMGHPTYLLNYEIYYKVSPEQNASIHQERDVCGNDDWQVMDVTKHNFVEAIHREHEFEIPHEIHRLKPFTQYAFYVKTVVIPLPESEPLEHNVGGISPICYITTLPSVPSKPSDVKMSPISSSSIRVEWRPPIEPNGVLEKYEIYLMKELEDEDYQRDYCKDRKEYKIFKPEEPPITSLVETESPVCCSCSGKTKTRNPLQSASSELLQADIFDSIMKAVFISSHGRRRREIGNLSDAQNVFDPVEFATEDQFMLAYESTRSSERMKLYKTVYVNETKKNGIYEVLLTELHHYTKYTIWIKACRENKTYVQKNGCAEKNETLKKYLGLDGERFCSDFVKETLDTLYSGTADLVDPNSIVANVTMNNVNFTWDDPKEPNGFIVSYHINVTRVDSGGQNEIAHPPECISRKNFKEKGNIYAFERPLHPGNYSVTIQAISTAPYEAEYSSPIYFQVFQVMESADGDTSTGHIVLFVGVPLFCFLVSTGVIYYVRKTRRLEKDQIVSRNPTYRANVNIPDELEIPLNKFVRGKLISQGSFGKVHEGKLFNFKNCAEYPCAIKTVAENSSSEDHFRFLIEANLMTKLDCHHVVKLLGVVSLSRPTYVIMELMELGDLKGYLRSRVKERNHPSLKEILRMLAGIADGMAYLDFHKFVHRDLAARNCMVAKDLTVKIGDFGMTRDVNSKDYYRKVTYGILPVRWMAPESIANGVFTPKSDVWSFGVVIWEMSTLGGQPYKGMGNLEVQNFVTSGGLMSRPENCPKILYDMMLHCWQFSPKDRPTFTNILEWLLPNVHPNFPSVSFYHCSIGVEYRKKEFAVDNPMYHQRNAYANDLPTSNSDMNENRCQTFESHIHSDPKQENFSDENKISTIDQTSQTPNGSPSNNVTWVSGPDTADSSVQLLNSENGPTIGCDSPRSNRYSNHGRSNSNMPGIRWLVGSGRFGRKLLHRAGTGSPDPKIAGKY